MIIDANGKRPFEIRDSTGKEFKKIYDADGNLLFKNWNTIQGTPPIVFKGYNRLLKNYKIYGNTVQNGTPTPEAPVDVVGSGVRTGNVMPAGEKKTVEVNGVTFSSDGNGRYRISGTASRYSSVQFDLVSGFTSPTSVSNGGQGTLSFFNNQSTSSVVLIFYNGQARVDDWVMKPSNRISTAYNAIGNKYVDKICLVVVNSGATVDMTIALEFTDDGILPSWYEPYGYKLPVTISNGVFLDEPLRGIGEYKDTLDLSTGVVTRRIKKLVLTGKEYWLRASSYAGCFYTGNAIDIASKAMFCTHLPVVSVSDFAQGTATMSNTHRINLWFGQFDENTTASDFKSYLAAQYANDTPVTVWYVLAEPETETVSVPSGLSGIIEGYCIQDGTPTPENPIEVVSNGTVQSDGTYLVPRTAQFITTPIYIGSEPLHKIGDYADYIDFERGVIVRRIKKLILTGEEIITKAASNPVFTMQLGGSNTPFSENAVTTLSTHYQAQNNVAGTGNVNDMKVCVRRGYGTMYIGDTRYDNTTDFKSYLATQYEAGTPVTVWYVLAEPEETPLSDLNPITPLKGANTLSTNTTIQPSEIYLKGKIKSLATHMLVDSSGNILLTSNNYQLVTKEE
jgi:hypothetical protein